MNFYIYVAPRAGADPVGRHADVRSPVFLLEGSQGQSLTLIAASGEVREQERETWTNEKRWKGTSSVSGGLWVDEGKEGNKN